MGLFDRDKRTGGFMDEIRCDEPSYLIWKWHPAGAQLGAGNRENAIRWGSSLRVKDGEVAVFVYKQKNGTMQDFIVGPFDQIIKTANFPVLASIVGLAYEGGTPFQAEVYFINLAQIIQVKFAVPFFDVYDPRFDDFGVPASVRGTISFKISNYRQFIKLHRLVSFNLEDFQRQIRDAVTRYVKDVVANAPATNNIPLVQIETKTAQINDVVEFDIGNRLKENFGVDISGVDIAAIEVDKSSYGYKQLMAVPILAYSRNEFVIYSLCLLVSGHPNTMVIFFPGNDVCPWIVDAFNIGYIFVSSHNPRIGAIAGYNTNRNIDAWEVAKQKFLQMVSKARCPVIVVSTWYINRTVLLLAL